MTFAALVEQLAVDARLGPREVRSVLAALLAALEAGVLREGDVLRIPGFGGIEYKSPFDPNVVVRSMVPVMFDYRYNTSYMTDGDCNSDGEASGFGGFDRPGIPVAAWFWKEE